MRNVEEKEEKGGRGDSHLFHCYRNMCMVRLVCNRLRERMGKYIAEIVSFLAFFKEYFSPFYHLKRWITFYKVWSMALKSLRIGYVRSQ